MLLGSAAVAPAQTITSSPALLAFSWQPGSPAPAAQTINIFGVDSTFFTVSMDQPWLRASFSRNRRGRGIRVSVMPGSLGAGTYAGNVIVTIPASTSFTLQVPVTLAVTASATTTPLVITTSSLPPATVGTPYSATIATSGGTAPYQWVAGGLPAGLAVAANSAGTTMIGGTPTAAGIFAVTVAISDSLGVSANASLSLTVADAQSSANPAANPTVLLTWTESEPAVAGYNVYRGTVTGGPYAMLNTQVVGAPSYDDASVQSGQTYYYVTSALDSNNDESSYSNEAAVAVP